MKNDRTTGAPQSGHHEGPHAALEAEPDQEAPSLPHLMLQKDPGGTARMNFGVHSDSITKRQRLT